MSEEDDLLLQRLLPIFREEARERITAIGENISALAHAVGATRSELVETMFREAHSLKAAARSIDQSEIELICQAMENVLASAKRDDTVLSPAVLQVLQGATDALEDSLMALGGAPGEERLKQAAELADALNAVIASPGATPVPAAPAPAPVPIALEPAVLEVPAAIAIPAQPAPPPRPPSEASIPVLDTAPTIEPAPSPNRARPAATALAAPVETVRLSVPRLSAVLMQAEEMVSQKLAAQQIAAELKEARETLSVWRKEWERVRKTTSLPSSLTRSHERDAVEPLLHFFERTESRVDALEAMLAGSQQSAAADARNIGVKVDGLLYRMKQVLMLQCSSLTQLLPRVVRDLAHDQVKEVDLVIRGAQLEIDRRILEELKDPLLHLVRNCVDHGIERIEERVALGKPRLATISLTIAARDGDRVEFIVADDGAGIATAKLAAAATKQGVLSAEGARAADAELLPLVFHSGISTSPMITEVSGRGLGLAIVREKVERLGGSVSVESQPGQGTTFRLLVPLTLATYHGIVVRVGERAVVLPTLNTERVVRFDRTAVKTVENRAVIDIGGVPVPLIGLRDVLEMPPAPAGGQASDRLIAAIVGTGAARVAFEVDSIDGDQEILVKPLGKCLVRVRNVQGAAILPTGIIAPILNVNDLLKSAAKLSRVAVREAIGADARQSPRKNILLAEDSITARALLRNIMETAGYQVKTAVDGMEAWSLLRTEPFDLLVSDVEMPRMNGFELTTRIRADKNLSELPVVLVTALASREDLERGVDAGANAYIPKGGFEQTQLLDALRRLA